MQAMRDGMSLKDWEYPEKIAQSTHVSLLYGRVISGRLTFTFFEGRMNLPLHAPEWMACVTDQCIVFSAPSPGILSHTGDAYYFPIHHPGP
jgi:hypothetical protein